ncbi:MAG: hypothetical protein ACREV3_01655 [Gammaproteobacteria bacterium]
MGFSLRILILAHYYPPEMGGAAARLHGLARWLKAFGHEVTVVTGMPNYPSGIVVPPYRGKLTFPSGGRPLRHPACLTQQYALRKPR